MGIIKKYKWYLITFLLTLTVMTVFFTSIGCFSDRTILTSDMQGQTFPLLQYLKNALNGDASFPYSFSKGLGGGMYGTIFYYLSNPINLLVYFFDDIPLFLLLTVILKISLCGLTMNIFLSHKFKENNWAIVVFSLAYAIMGYNINYYTNFMWLDGVFLAPLILIGIDRIIEGKKDWLYIILLFVAIICNYYIGYMLCIFSAIYFGYNLLLKYDYKKDKKIIWRQIFHFAIITCLVGIMCAFILIPSAVELFHTHRVLTLKDAGFINWNFFDYFAPLYIGFGNLVNPLNFYGFNIYCGLLMLPLVILYFKNSKISKKEKRLTAVVFLIFALPITFNYINYIWHMFSVTVFFNYRYSFLATLFTLYIAYKSYRNLEVNKKTLTVTYIIMLIISAALLYLTYSAPDYYVYLNWKKIILTLILLFLYIVLLIKGKKKIALGIVFVEIILNLSIIGYTSNMPSRSEYNKFIELLSPFTEICSDKRCETTVGFTMNDPLYWNYSGVTSFLSTNNKNGATFLSKVSGIQEGRNYFVYTYNNPVLNMLMGIEYVMDTRPFNEYEVVTVIDGINIYKNNHALGLGYLVDHHALDDFDTEATGIFYQEEFLNLLKGTEEKYFIELPVEKIDDFTYEVTVDINYSYIYIYSDSAPSVNGVDNATRELYVYTADEYGILYNKPGDDKLLLEYKEKPEKVKLYYLDYSKLVDFYQEFSKKELVIEENTGNYIKGNIAVEEDSVLLFTVPFERGWAVKVNGERVFVFPLADTFTGIYLSEGEYTIELIYKAHGVKESILVSILAFITLLIYEFMLNKKWQKKLREWVAYDILEKFSKKKTGVITYILIISVIGSISLLLIQNMSWGHDLPFHLSRIANIHHNLSVGQIGSYIYPNYLGGYGYGIPLFYPDVFLYIPAILMYMGMSLITAYKVFVFLIAIFSTWSMYIAVKNITKNNKAALFSATLYGLSSYRLIDVFSRAAIGESLAFIFAPLIIYGIYEIIYGECKKFYILVIGMTGLILSHVISSVIMIPLLMVLCLINIKKFFIDKKRMLYLFISALVTLGLTCFFLFPMLEQMLTVDFLYKTQVAYLKDNAISVWMFFVGVPYYWFQRKYIPSGFGIGFAMVIYLYFKNINKKEVFLNFCIISGIVLIIFASNIFPWGWEFLTPVLKYIQFPWRLYFFATLLLCIGGGLLYKKIAKNTKLINLILMICLLPVISMYFMNASAKVVTGMEESLGSAEYLNTNINIDVVLERGSVIESKHDINLTFEKKDLNITVYFEDNEFDNELEIPLIYYNGYRAKMNGTIVPVHITSNGLVGVNVSEASGIIEIGYGGTTVQKATKWISIIAWLIFLSYLGFIYKKRNI